MSEPVKIQLRGVASVLASDEDTIELTIPMTALYQFALNIIPYPGQGERAGFGAGFLAALEYYQHLLGFTQLIRYIPKIIPAGQMLPYWYFMRSPFSETEYWTASNDFHLDRISYTPLVHVNTGLELPLALTATLVWDVRLVYKRIRPINLPDLMPSYERIRYEEFTADFPRSEFWGNTTIDAFQRVVAPSYCTIFCYIDSLPLWNGIIIPDDIIPYSFIYKRMGLKSTEQGRYYMYGDTREDTELYPYHSIEPIPSPNIRWELEELSGSQDTTIGRFKCIASSIPAYLYYAKRVSKSNLPPHPFVLGLSGLPRRQPKKVPHKIKTYFRGKQSAPATLDDGQFTDMGGLTAW